MVDRRKFVSSSVAALVAASVDPSLLSASEHEGPSAEDFRGALHQFFQLQGELWHRVELVKVNEITVSPGLEQFSLVFRGSVNDAVREGIYEVTGPGVERFSATLHPAGTEAFHNYYISHFSRIRPWFREVLERERARTERGGE